MLRRRTEPSGEEVLVRDPYRAEDFTPTPEQLEPITSMGFQSVRENLRAPDGPFGNFWTTKIERDGKTYWRFCEKREEWCILIEDSDYPMGWTDIQVLPPEDALAISRSYDSSRGLRVID